MKIALGSDHGGFQQKKRISTFLSQEGHQVVDLGCYSVEPCDYPDYAQKVSNSILEKEVDRGILFCGTGIGMSIAANKIKGIRAAVCWDSKTAELASEHNDANILCLSGRFLSGALIIKMVRAWLHTPFSGDRHLKRIKKIQAIERKSAK